MANFIQQIRTRTRTPTSAIAAAHRIQEAAAAASHDLSEFFVKRWRWSS